MLNKLLSSAFIVCSFLFVADVNANSNVVEVETEDGKSVYCGYVDDSWIPGRLNRKQVFVSLQANIKKRRKAKKKSSRAKVQIKKLRRRIKKEKSYCEQLNSDTTGIVPLPTSTPTGSQPDVPSEQPDDRGTGFFDSQGNVTESGKSQFRIPSNLTGNITRGKTIQQNTCAGCHSERVNYNFVVLRRETSEAPMFFTEANLPDQDLADLTAYLNRFQS